VEKVFKLILKASDVAAEDASLNFSAARLLRRPKIVEKSLPNGEKRSKRA